MKKSEDVPPETAPPKRFRLYVDESGDHTYKHLGDPSKKYLGLTGILIESQTYRTQFHPGLEKLKQNHFPHDPDFPLVLHRKELINRNGAFRSLLNPTNEKEFNKDLLEFLSFQDYRIFSVAIDKEAHESRYGAAAFHPYHFCLAVLMERCCGYLNLIGARGDIMAESRGGSEDMQLKRAYQDVWDRGTQHRGAAFFKRALTSKDVKLEKKRSNISGLQVADLLAHPIKQDILRVHGTAEIPVGDFANQICKAIASKYNKQEYTGRVEGYGRIFLR